MLVHEFRNTWLLCLAVMGCSGCSRAPSIEIIGSFFPGMDVLHCCSPDAYRG